ncbi:MAG: hypothetical protein HOO86_12395 [Bacteroidales bacterium]|nr:hypothetical protein [Bacteroidales bacterium]
MIRFLKHDEIDKNKWDSCIKEAFNGNIYGWSWYLDIVHPNWNALVDDDYERIFPLTGNNKFGIGYLFQPFFSQQLGIYSISILNPAIVQQFLSNIPAQYQFIEIRLNSHNKTESEGYEMVKHLNHELDLINSYDRIFNKYSTNTKRNLRKAHEAGLTINKNGKAESIIRLFRSNRGRTISHWNDLEYARLLNLTQMANYRGQALVYAVHDSKNELCAGAIFMQSHYKIVFLFSGANQTAKENHALTFLLDSVIKEFAPSQFTLDFEGSDDEGLARFYKGFGSKQTDYPGIVINRLPLVWKIGMKIIRRLKSSQ